MCYKYITIPYKWVAEENIVKYIKKSVKEFFEYTRTPGLVLLSYIVEEDSFYYTGELLSDSKREYICNSEEEFEQMIAQARLEKIL